MKSIIVREYLESLTESNELDYLFPLLLEVMGFKIISTPKWTKGLPQYGKDVIAVGEDADGIRKRFYFEVKGGADRHVTTGTYNKTDGIRESIIEAKDRPYKDSSDPSFNSLPVKIVLVHNGTIHPSVKETFDGFIEREFPSTTDTTAGSTAFQFERWDIYRLTDLFTVHLFNEYLLTDEEAVQHFKKVLVLINTPRNDYRDFFVLINTVFEKAGKATDLGERKKLLFFETVRLICFIIYSYSKQAGNLNAALRCIPYAVLRLWHWILENGLEGNAQVTDRFRSILQLFKSMLGDYISKTLPAAMLPNGLWSPSGGRYEQIGYPVRTLDYLGWLTLHFELLPEKERYSEANVDQLISVINANADGIRPQLDNHSIPLALVLNFFIKAGNLKAARSVLRNCIHTIMLGYRTHNRLPDANNNIESVLQYAVTRKKSIYYHERTSHLFTMLTDHLALLDIEEEYNDFKEFLKELAVDTSLFIPYNDAQLATHLPDAESSHELNLFQHELREEGYQMEIQIDDSFEEYKKKRTEAAKFAYTYRTTTAGFPELITLAHVYFKTPFFSNFWMEATKP